MAEVLLINVKDIVTLSALGGNVDTDYVTPFVKIAQDSHILPVLGTQLMDKIKDGIEDDTLAGAYLELWGLVKPCLAHFVMVEYIPYNTYKIKNAGTLQGAPENATAVSHAQMVDLVDREMNTARAYLRRVEEYICANTEDLPEYSQNTSGDVSPESSKPFYGMTF